MCEFKFIVSLGKSFALVRAGRMPRRCVVTQSIFEHDLNCQGKVFGAFFKNTAFFCTESLRCSLGNHWCFECHRSVRVFVTGLSIPRARKIFGENCISKLLKCKLTALRGSNQPNDYKNWRRKIFHSL